MANRFPLIFNSGAGQIQELAASDNLDLTSSNLVNAGILFTSSGSQTAPSISIGNGTTYPPGLYSPGTDQVAVATNGTQRLAIDATGNIKLTTSQYQALAHKFYGYGSPAYGAVTVGATGSNFTNVSLGVDVSTISGAAFSGQNQVIFPANGALVPNNAGTNFIGVFARNSSDSLLIGPDCAAGISNGPLTVTSTSLGIGTSSPGSKFDVNGSAVDFDAARFLNTNSDGSVATSSAIKLGITNTAGERYARIQATEIGGNNNNVSLDFYTNSSASSTGETIKMRIEHSGNVGIGTTSPSEMLTLNDGNINIQGNTADRIHFSGDGTKYLSNTGDPSTSILALRGRAGLIFNTGGDVTYNGGSERLRITSTGALNFVGAGTAGSTQAVSFSGSAPVNSVVLDSSGRLLVGTSSGSSVFYGVTPQLQVEGTNENTSSLSVFNNQSSSTGAYIAIGKSRGTSIGSSAIVNSGDAIGGIYWVGADGTDRNTPAAQINCEVDGTPGANDMPGRLVFSTTPSGSASPSLRMTIKENGQILFNTSDSTAIHAGRSIVFTLGQNGDIAVNHTTANISGDSFARFGYNGTQIGSITQNGTTAVAYNTSSDYRLKENVTAVTNAITRFQQLKPSSFNFIGEPDRTVDGFLAHEAQEVVPECVTGEKDAVDEDGNPVYQGIDQSKLVPLLTAALQEAIAKIETLEARITALEP